MVFQPEFPVYDPGVYEYEVVDPVQGGVGGVANSPILSLSNRTAWLKQQLDKLLNGSLIPPTVAPLNGPAFTGSCTAPNVAPGDNSTLIANTNFVQTAKAGAVHIAISSPNIVLTQPQWGVNTLLCSGILTAASALIFPAQFGSWEVQNFTTGPFTLGCKCAGGAAVNIPQGGSLGIYCDGSAIWAQNTIVVATGQITPTGVVPGTYTKLNCNIQADGRITAAANGVVSFADVVGGLGWIPVQQGTGVGQLGNQVKIGWSAATRLKATVDATDLGNIAMEGAANLFTQNQTFSSPIVLNNNVGIYWKDTSGNLRLADFLGADNHHYIRTGLAGNLFIQNAAGNVNVVNIDGVGNLTAAVRLRAAFGAYLSGDINAATILNDFVTTGSSDPSNYIYHRDPDGFTIQAYTGTNTTGADIVTFPIAFSHTCVQVLAGEGLGSGWGGGASPTIFGTQQQNTSQFALYVTKLLAGNWSLTGGIAYRYIAIGF